MRMRTAALASAAVLALGVGGIIAATGATGGSAPTGQSAAAATSAPAATPKTTPTTTTTAPAAASTPAMPAAPTTPSGSTGTSGKTRLVMGKYDPSEFAAEAAKMPAGLDTALAKINLTPAQFLADGQAGSDATTVEKELQTDGVNVTATRMEGTQLIVTVPTAAEAQVVESYGATAEVNDAPPATPAPVKVTAATAISPAQGNTPLEGGDGWQYLLNASTADTCSVGFTGYDTSGAEEFATAGHCAVGSTLGAAIHPMISAVPGPGNSQSWDSTSIGIVDPSRFKIGGGDDYGTVAINNANVKTNGKVTSWGSSSASTSHAGIQNTGVDVPIIGEEAPQAGNAVCHSGYRTGYQCGYISQAAQLTTVAITNPVTQQTTNQTVNNFITNVFTCPGDSGGAAVVGEYAVGTLTGDNQPVGQCSSSYTVSTFFPLISPSTCSSQCGSFQAHDPSFQLGVSLAQPTVSVTSTGASGTLSGPIPSPTTGAGTTKVGILINGNWYYSPAITGSTATTGSAYSIAFPTMGPGIYSYTVEAVNGYSTSPTTTGTLNIPAPIAANVPMIYPASGSAAVTTFVGSDGSLYVQTGSATAVKLPNQAVMSGTSPSIATLANGTHMIAYQGTTGLLYTTTSTGTVTGGVYGMKAGTSPSIAPYNGGYEVAFQANTGHLLTASSSNFSDSAAGTKDWSYGMAAGTSPSITAYNGGYEVAFQANNSYLWTVGVSSQGVWNATNLGYGMAASTSPSIAWLTSGGYEVAFQANTGYLYTVGSGTGSSNHGAWDASLIMKAGTSPSITAITAAGGGGYKVAFQINTGALWVVGEGTSGANPFYSNWVQTVQAGTSPAIIGLSPGGYEMVARLSNGWLYLVGGGTGALVTGTVTTAAGPQASPAIS